MRKPYFTMESAMTALLRDASSSGVSQKVMVYEL